MLPSKDIFQTTLSEFKNRLTQRERDKFQCATFEDVCRELARIQKEQESSKTMMDMTRIQSFLEAMNQFGQIVEVFVNSSEMLAFVWGPLKFILKTASYWADAFDTLLGAYQQIGEHIPLLKQYKAVFEYDPEMRKVLGHMYHDILEFHKGALRFLSGPVWRRVFRAMWKDFGTRFHNILERLCYHRDLIASQAALVHFRQYQEDRQSTITQFEETREKMIDHFEKTEIMERHKVYTLVMEWISGAQTQLDHEACCQERAQYPGTGEWILKHDKIKDWREADTPVSSILWLNGIPGAGKTILSSVIIAACLQDKSFITSCFYCKDGDSTKNSCVAIVKGLLSQLLRQHRDLLPFCYDRYLSSGELTLGSSTLSNQLLELFCEDIPKQYIIIDGLDECDVKERNSVFTFFTKMVKQCDIHNPGKLRILFVSQEYNDIRSALLSASTISLRPTDNETDIKSYVHKRAQEIQERYELDDRQIDAIRDLTCARARGMFLFAKLVMHNLYAQPTRQQLLEEIKAQRFPQGLEQAYERILSRIKRNATPGEWQIARKLLGWMVCTKRPLKWYEIQCAMSINPDEQTIDFDDRKLRVHIQDLCGSLVQVLPGDSGSTGSDAGDRIELVHNTANAGDRIELVHNTAKAYITSTGHVSEFSVECSLASLCLRYLTFECFEIDISEGLLRQQAKAGYLAFQDYAVAKGLHHLLEMVRTGDNIDPTDSDTAAALQEVDPTLNDFLEIYETEVVDEHEDVSEQACKAFDAYSFYENLCCVWNHVHRHQQKDFAARNQVSIPTLSKALTRNRKLLEDLPKGPSSGESFTKHEQERIEESLNTFYGRRRYKCPKVTCFFFHEGFKDAKTRDQHVHRHDRPFLCTYPDCGGGDFGFASKKDLDKHKRSFHPETSDLAEVFGSTEKETTTARHKCHICNKPFTRSFQMRNHIRATHMGDRPFACTRCGRGFARDSDRKRHENTIHNR